MNTDKFNAALLTQETKDQIVALRNKASLSERALMTLVVAIALESEARILEQAAAINAVKDNERTEKKKASYEALKIKIKAERAERAALREEQRKQLAEMAAKAKAQAEAEKVQAEAASAAPVATTKSKKKGKIAGVVTAAPETVDATQEAVAS